MCQHDGEKNTYTSAFIAFAQFLANLSSAKGEALCAICNNNGNEQGSEKSGKER
jgi:ligand-binding sensor protein